MIITLDLSCIIAVEQAEEPAATAIREVALLCGHRQVTLAVYSYLPLENQPRDRRRDFVDFPQRLAALGIGEIETLHPAANPALLRWISSILFPSLPYELDAYLAAECAKAGISYEALQDATRDKRPPAIPWSPDAARAPLAETLDPASRERLCEFWRTRRRKWNNAKSDVLALGAHITWAYDGIFMTDNTKHFQRNLHRLRSQLPELRILTPMGVLQVLREGSVST